MKLKLLCVLMLVLLATQTFAQVTQTGSARGGTAPTTQPAGSTTPAKGGTAPATGTTTTSNYYYSTGPGTQWQIDPTKPTLPSGWTTTQIPYKTTESYTLSGDKITFSTPLCSANQCSTGQTLDRSYTDGTTQTAITNNGQSTVLSVPPQSITTRTTPAGTQLYYNGEQVQLAPPGATYTFQTTTTSFFGGTETTTYTFVNNGAVRENSDGERDILNNQGKPVATGIEPEQWATFQNTQDVVNVANSFNEQGVSLNDATYVDSANGGTYVIDSWIWGSDIIVQTNGGSTTTTRGSVNSDGTLDTTSSYETTTKSNDGKITEHSETSDGTTTTTQYTYSADGKTQSWTVNDGKGEAQVYTRNSDKNSPEYGQVTLPSGITYNPDTGKYYGADGKELTGTERTNAENANKDDVARVDAANKGQQPPSRWERAFSGGIYTTITELFNQYQQWRGLGAYGALFIGDEELAARRARVAEQFCKYDLGIDCIVADLCEHYSDKESEDNVLVVVDPGTGVRAAAHVEAQRSEEIKFKDGTSQTLYLYTITYYAASPDKDNHVQLRFFYEGGTYDWYPEPGVVIQKGGSVSAKGPAALAKYSSQYYTAVCLFYESGIETGTGSKKSKVCTSVADVGLNPATPPVSPPAGAGSTPATTPTTTPGGGF